MHVWFGRKLNIFSNNNNNNNNNINNNNNDVVDDDDSDGDDSDVVGNNSTKWFWHGDTDWVGYSEETSATLEAAYLTQNQAKVQIDSERYVDMNNRDSMMQRRIDNPNRRRTVKRELGEQNDTLTRQQQPLQQLHALLQLQLQLQQQQTTPSSSAGQTRATCQWYWANDGPDGLQTKLVAYASNVNEALERGFQSGAQRVDVDDERYVDMSEPSNLLQRRADTPSRRRRVERKASNGDANDTAKMTSRTQPTQLQPTQLQPTQTTQTTQTNPAQIPAIVTRVSTPTPILISTTPMTWFVQAPIPTTTTTTTTTTPVPPTVLRTPTQTTPKKQKNHKHQQIKSQPTQTPTPTATTTTPPTTPTMRVSSPVANQIQRSRVTTPNAAVPSPLSSLSFPEYWTITRTVNRTDFPVASGTPEFNHMSSILQTTIADYHIRNSINHKVLFTSFQVTKVVRVQNPSTWLRYNARRKLIAQLNPPPVPHVVTPKPKDSIANECYLLHGLNTKYLDDITQDGFDPRHCSLDGMFGAGLYFAENSSKSNQYCHGPPCTQSGAVALSNQAACKCTQATEVCMLVCRVVLGDALIEQKFRGNAPGQFWNGRRTEPPKPDGKSVYNSVVGESKQNHPSSQLMLREYIVYEPSQIYPEYKVFYRRVV